MDEWFLVANVKPLSLNCKPKEFSLVSEEKLSLLLLQHCQTFLSAHATPQNVKYFLKIQYVTNPKTTIKI